MGIIFVAAGAVLAVLGFMNKVDSYWTGLGGGLIGVGIIQIIRWHRYHSDEEYRENFDINNNDERNIYLNERAASWTFRISVIAATASAIIAKLMGYGDISFVLSMVVCALLMIYLGVYIYFSKKF